MWSLMWLVARDLKLEPLNLPENQRLQFPRTKNPVLFEGRVPHARF